MSLRPSVDGHMVYFERITAYLQSIPVIMEQTSTLDKFTGTLVGCAVGDALGAPVEGMTPEAIGEMYGRVTGFIDARFGPGRITDDTQMTVLVAQTISEIGRFDLEQAGIKFGRWIKTSDDGIKEARGVGMACGVACRRLSEGADPLSSGVDSAGCGAAMRASPIGLRYYHDHDELRRTAVLQSRVTHTNPEASAGAAAAAFAVAIGVTDDGALDRAALAERTGAFVERIDRGMAVKITGLADYLDASPEEGFAYTGTGGHVMETVPAAFFAFLRSPYDPEETLLTAVNAGGDTDSVGAIAGAISGAFNGLGALPARMRDEVEGREYIEGLARRLYTLTPAGRPSRRPLF